MSTTIENPLTTTTVQQWKRICINEALKLNAYTILIGEETAPLSDAKLLANYYDRRSKMVGYLRSTLDASQTETILSTIGITDLHSCWKALLNVYKLSETNDYLLYFTFSFYLNQPLFTRRVATIPCDLHCHIT